MKIGRYGTRYFGGSITDIIIENLPYDTPEEKAYVDNITSKITDKIEEQIINEIKEHLNEQIETAIEKALD